MRMFFQQWEKKWNEMRLKTMPHEIENMQNEKQRKARQRVRAEPRRAERERERQFGEWKWGSFRFCDFCQRSLWMVTSTQHQCVRWQKGRLSGPCFRENCPVKVSRVQNFSDFFLPMDRGFCVLSTTMVTFCHREECFGLFIQRFWTAPVCGLKNIRHRKKGKNVLALYAHQSVLIMWACETGPRPWYDNIPIPCRRFVFSHRFLTTT